MSGKLWMFSDQLDDEDLKFARHSFFRYADGIVYYRLTEKTITRLAKNGMIVIRQIKRCLIRHFIFSFSRVCAQ